MNPLKNIQLTRIAIAVLAANPLLPGLQVHADSSGSFGRLFTTVEERIALDQWATGPKDQPPPAVAGETSSTAAQPQKAEPVAVAARPERATLSGVLLRSDGRHVVWLDGKSELSAEGSAPRVRAGLPRDGSLRVPVRAEDDIKWLKPGQVWLIGEGRVEEAYQVSAAPGGPGPDVAPDEPY